MSLLNRGTESITVFPEETRVDGQGNTLTRASSVGIVARGVVQPMTTTEDNSVGFATTSKYRLRLVGYPGTLGAQAQVLWQGRRYSIEGEPLRFNGSPRTAHVDYIIVRE